MNEKEEELLRKYELTELLPKNQNLDSTKPKGKVDTTAMKGK